METVEIAKLAQKTSLVAGNWSILIRSSAAFSESQLNLPESELKSASSFGIALNTVLPILLERDIAHIVDDGSIAIPANNTYHLYSDDYGLSSYLPSLCPFTLNVQSHGSIGREDFRYEYSFYAGPERAYGECYGAFFKNGSRLFLLQESLFELISEVDSFNALPVAQKNKVKTLKTLARVKSLGQKSPVNFDSYIVKENVVTADNFSLSVRGESSDRISLYPRFDGVDESELNKQYFGLSDAQQVYDLSAQDGGRVRLVLSDDVYEAVSRVRPHVQVSGKSKDKLLADPRAIFDGIENVDVVDVGQFGPRVKGIGNYIFQPRIFIKQLRGGFLERSGTEADVSADAKAEVAIEASDCNGQSVIIPIGGKEDLDELAEKLKAAEEAEESVITVLNTDGSAVQVPVTPELSMGIKSLVKEFDSHSDEEPVEKEKSPPKNRQYVLIHDNEEDVNYSELNQHSQGSTSLKFERPVSLIEDLGGAAFDLKSYQKEGVAWLQEAVRSIYRSARTLAGKRGGLLADEMGLGKTLQILTFIAWCLENPELLVNDTEKRTSKPILVIAPVILLENWKNEMGKFFKNDGAIFQPFEILHGNTLKDYRVVGRSGKEFEVGKPTLDLSRIRENRVVVTNYDTVKNFQHSFAMVEWSVVVIDEAQEIKEAKTTVTMSVKSLNADLKIAMTGTPVENRLLDLWNIVDFCQPGLLGSASEFYLEYEHDVHSLPDAERQVRADRLRRCVKYDTPGTYLLRRTKEEKLEGLPSKTEVIRSSELSSQQIQLHNSILQELRKNPKKPGAHLVAVQRLSKIYQHISLDMDSRIDQPGKYYVKSSPKLQDTVSLLREIKARNEKVLVFALFTKMQLILQKAIQEEFGIDVRIINGSVNTTTTGFGNIRHKIIKQFESKPGFNVLILSPDVAGVGLTITAANNVIHFGRWWNPAKEAQATDRVHRIGQTQPVNVYIPISRSSGFETFDERLHTLLCRKRELAKDFLAPMSSLNVTEDELIDGFSTSIATFSDRELEKNRVRTVKELDRKRFSALCYLFMVSEGYDCRLAPINQSGGIEIIARKANNAFVCLVECSEDGEPSISKAQVASARAQYEKWYPEEKASIELRLFVNKKVTRALKTLCSDANLTLVPPDDLERLLKKKVVLMPELNEIIEGKRERWEKELTRE